MMTSPGRLASAALVLLVTAAGCMTGPYNGTTTADSVVGKSFLFQGYYNEPNTTISLQVLKTPDADPSVAANWIQFATAVTETSPTTFNSTDPIYYWSVNAAPVPNIFTTARWPTGGLVKVRGIAKDPDGDINLYTFDEVTFGDCLGEHINDDWATVGIECQGVGLNRSAFVSTALSPVTSATPPNYLGRKGDISTVETEQYYAQIQAPASFTAFRTRYGFASGDITATYYNDGDLGIGREMHCRTFSAANGQGVACYVRNYGVLNGQPSFGGDPTSALSDAVNRVNSFATVAMVFEPPANTANSVKFMVFDGPSGVRVPTAKLDSTGQHVSVPNNCLTCHGINSYYDSSTNSVSGAAKFLPFDVFSFKYSTASGFTQAAQADALRRLNQLVSFTSPTQATSEFITGLYAPKAVGDSTAVANNTYVPVDWTTNKRKGLALYNGVVKQYCRTCHMSATVPSYDFLQEDDFHNFKTSINADVCGAGHEMPQAEHVMRKFWNSGARAYLDLGLGLNSPCKP
ncbi:hypothetical protein JY651_27045 [Pyxidicoccus parkwayensis]|uniref:Lipoprotein n=1 Tax=Pyxidicoccus parkwayensis TaxID=2813578 RepID=A0ABX7NJG2_9BACT|nr:hypothetical protein [Pyxidicoccus parkwaysis]QSQ19005.1 hypothetical protein JY651_27045 [Pyxidicoccus parkwaysis]